MNFVDYIRSGERQEIIVALQILRVILKLVIIPIVIAIERSRFPEIFLLK